MDHKRIEWLFFIVFVLINLYLGIEIWRSPVRLNDATTKTNANLRTEMQGDGIELPRNISDKIDAGYYLATKEANYLSDKVSTLTAMNAEYTKGNSTLTATPKMTVTLGKTPTEIVARLNKFKNVSANVAYGHQFTYETNLSGGDTYVFVQTSTYGRIYDDNAVLTFTVRSGRLVMYTQTYIGPVRPVRELQSTISGWHAVSTMYTDQELANNSKIVALKLGYSKMTVVRGSVILLPSWLVWVENKETKNITLKRVNAFNGQILQANTTYSVEKN